MYLYHLLFFHLSTSNKQGISCFHKSNGTCLCYFYHVCFILRWLLGWFLRLSKFDWFLWVSHSTLRNTFNSLCRSIIIWIKFHWLSTLNKLQNLFQLKISFHFFLTNSRSHFLQEYYLEYLYVINMSRTCFTVNLHSIVAWISRNSLLENGAVSEA